MKMLPASHPIFREGVSLVGVKKMPRSTSDTEPSIAEGPIHQGIDGPEVHQTSRLERVAKDDDQVAATELIDQTGLPNIPKFRTPKLGESPRAYAQALAEATRNFVQQALKDREFQRRVQHETNKGVAMLHDEERS